MSEEKEFTNTLTLNDYKEYSPPNSPAHKTQKDKDCIIRAFRDAVESGNIITVEYLSTFEQIQNSSILNQGLITASLNGHSEIVKFLILKGANRVNDALNVIIDSGRFELELHQPVILELIRSGADINRAFEKAIEIDNVSLFRFLIDEGAHSITEINKENAIARAKENIRKIISERKTEQCMLCMDEMNPSHSILKLECNHSYHNSCVLNWINAQVNAGVEPRCPYCKKMIF
ncbi:MAG: RING finger domain-containing protein [bacterium]